VYLFYLLSTGLHKRMVDYRRQNRIIIKSTSSFFLNVAFRSISVSIPNPSDFKASVTFLSHFQAFINYFIKVVFHDCFILFFN
jgi:hypothetical protein